MHQDEAGRWVSDNGRYLWSGTEWLDLQPDEADPEADEVAPNRGATLDRGDRTEELAAYDPGTADEHAAADNGGTDDAGSTDEPEEPREPNEPAAVAGPPPTAAAPAVARRRTRGEGRSAKQHRGPGRRRGLLLGLAVVVLAAVVAVVLVVGNRSPSRPTSAAPAPASGAATPGGVPSSPSTTAVLDEQQRRDRAEGALVGQSDIPTSTEQRPVNPTDVFLPCRAAALTPPAGTVLLGRTVSNSDFTVYVGQTIAGYPTVREASEALDAVRTALGRCAPYDYDYANSPRVDHITHTDVGAPLDIGDGGVYLTEVDTPANYAGTTTAYSYGYMRQGQFLVRLTLTNRSQADRGGVELLMRRIAGQLG